jgi:hypothetical protein
MNFSFNLRAFLSGCGLADNAVGHAVRAGISIRDCHIASNFSKVAVSTCNRGTSLDRAGHLASVLFLSMEETMGSRSRFHGSIVLFFVTDSRRQGKVKGIGGTS